MPEAVEDKLRKRFQTAIEKTVHPAPLTSPRWLKHYPDGKPTDFRYIGAPRVAKATGRQIAKVAREILRKVRLDDLGLKADIRSNGWIDLSFRRDNGGQST